MSWIETISYRESKGKLRKLYDRTKTPEGKVDNILKAHSLRPHSLQGHMGLYKNVLHHAGNVTPKWKLEMLGVYVSKLNGCEYCVAHHSAGLKALVNDSAFFELLIKAIECDDPALLGDDQLSLVMHYAKVLTLTPQKMNLDIVRNLRSAGISDGEILEINQVCSYFSYANRTVLGLGVNTQGDVLGYAPSDNANADNWQHAKPGTSSSQD